MLKMTIKTFFIGLIILFNCQQLLASAVGNSNMLPATGKFYAKTSSLMANSHKKGNHAISPMALIILDFIFYAAANKQIQEEYEKFYFYTKNSEEVVEALQLSSFDIVKQVHDLRLSQPAKQIVDVGTSITLNEEFKENPGANKFLAFIKDNFPSAVSFEDLSKNREAAQEKMNKWAEEMMRGHAKSFIPLIIPESKLAAVAALYVRAKWLYSFDSVEKLQTFYALKEGRTERQQVKFRTMSELAHNDYDAYNYDSVTAVRIPMQQKGMAMIIYMPDSQAFSSFLEDWSQDNDLLDRILTQSQRTRKRCRLRVTMPKFNIPAPSEELYLGSVHQHFGLTSLFDVSVPALSFSDEIGIQKTVTFFHKAMVIVDEPAAAFAASFAVPPAADQYLDIVIERPFLFQIVGYPFEGKGKMVYFTGQISDAELAQQ